MDGIGFGLGNSKPERGSLVDLAYTPFTAGGPATLNRWFDALSWPEAQRDRELATMRALAARLSGQGRDEVERWLRVRQKTDPTTARSPSGSRRSAPSSRWSARRTSAGASPTPSERRGSCSRASRPEAKWRYAGLVPLGQALFLAGRNEEAHAPLEEARTLPGARRRATSAWHWRTSRSSSSRTEMPSARKVSHGTASRSPEEIGHAATPTAANPHLALGCVLMRSADLHAAIEHLERAVELAGADEPSYWHAHALIHLAAARLRWATWRAPERRSRHARAELDELPDVGDARRHCYEETRRCAPPARAP